MSSIINASVSSNGIVSTADASGRILLQSNGTNTNAMAWVAFNSNTQTILSSYNVASITYLSTTRYQINFTNAMTNGNYAVALAASDTPTIGTYLVVDNSQLPTTTALTLYSNASGRFYYSAVVFGQ